MKDLLEKLLSGEVLQGEEALTVLQGLGWRAGVQTALILLERGEYSDTVAVLESLLKDAEDAVAAYESLLEAGPLSDFPAYPTCAEEDSIP